MSITPRRVALVRQINSIRITVLVNFFLLALVLWPLSSQAEETVLAAMRGGIGELVFDGARLWVVGSTLFATALLMRHIIKRPSGTPPFDGTPKGLVLDAVLLCTWWVTLLGACAYAFMLGMAG